MPRVHGCEAAGTSSTWAPRRVGAMVAALAIVAVSIGLGLVRTPPARAADPPWTLTASRTTDLTDGTEVVLNLKTRQQIVQQVLVGTCRLGVAFPTLPISVTRPAVFLPNSASECAGIAVSTSQRGPYVTFNNDAGRTELPEGENFSYFAGVGTVAWPNPDGPNRLSCDASNPCQLVAYLKVDGVGWQSWTQQMTYKDENPVSSCGGLNQQAFTSTGVDRMSDAVNAFTVNTCHAPGQTGALGGFVVSGEDQALKSYADRSADLAYSGAGFDPSIAMVPADLAAQRPFVAVPIAVNATGIGVIRRWNDPVGRRQRFTDVSLTAEEAARLFSGGFNGTSSEQKDVIRERNPQLKASGVFTEADPFVSADSNSAMSSWIGMRYFKELGPAGWVVPDLPAIFGPDINKPRGIDTTFGRASPSFVSAVDTKTGREQLRPKIVGEIPAGLIGAGWVLSDMATLSAFGTTAAKLTNTSGTFVAPDAATMTAAINASSTTTTSDGIVITDPKAVAPQGQTQPYPLTFVEYAIVPLEPLTDASQLVKTPAQTNGQTNAAGDPTETITGDCTLREDSEKQLKTWLDYAIGDGQAVLPAGLVPLTPALKDQAKAALAKVGSGEVTGDCKGRVVQPVPPTPPEGTDPGAPDGIDDNSSNDFGDSSFDSSSDIDSGGDFDGGGGGGNGSGGGGRSAAAQQAAADAAKAAANAIAAASNSGPPGFLGVRLTSGLVAVLGLIVIVVLTTFATRATSGGKNAPAGEPDADASFEDDDVLVDSS